MKIRSFAHKGLKRLHEDDSAKDIPPGTADKLRKMFAFLDAMQEAGRPASCGRLPCGSLTR